jgi:hypothetical protein
VMFNNSPFDLDSSIPQTQPCQHGKESLTESQLNQVVQPLEQANFGHRMDDIGSRGYP